MDKILIKDLLVRCTIGVTAEERREKEDVLVNVVIHGDFSRAAKSDQLEDAIDYRQLKKRIFALVEKSRYNLVEAVAERVASACVSAPGVCEVQVTVEKPGALRFARSVAVEVSRRADRSPVEAFVSFGSNVEPEDNILDAIALLKRHVRVLSCSHFYRTQGLGLIDSPPFINGVLKIETTSLPLDLKFGVLRPIEEQLGRVRTEDRNAQRTIDLDLVLYGDLVIKHEELVVPDPEIGKRDFLAIPLSELAPDLMLPGTHQRLGELARGFEHHSMNSLVEYTSRVRREIGVDD